MAIGDPARTRELVHETIAAAQQGSRIVTLSGLVPTTTGRGEALDLVNLPEQQVTTAHARTTVVIVAILPICCGGAASRPKRESRNPRARLG